MQSCFAYQQDQVDCAYTFTSYFFCRLKHPMKKLIHSVRSKCPNKLIYFTTSSVNQKRLIIIFLPTVCLTVIVMNYTKTGRKTNYPAVFKPQFDQVNDRFRSKSVRICCLVLTAPEFFLTRARAVHDTWAPRCDRYFFISEYPNENSTLEERQFAEQMPLLPLDNIKPGRKHLTEKITAAFLFAYEHYFNDFDWFLKADDDTYIIVENLRKFLIDKDAAEPVTFGYNFKLKVQGGYHSGGASYVLSREALQRFHKGHQVSKNTSCEILDGVEDGIEDVKIAQCLRGQGVHIGKSLDEHGRELFHPLPFTAHFDGTFPDWMSKYASNRLRTHYNCCSDRTISFHYILPAEIYYADFLLYKVRLR